jgi:hypothetical protein
MWSGGLASTFTGKHSNYNVAHPLRVLLDPRKFGKIRTEVSSVKVCANNFINFNKGIQ